MLRILDIEHHWVSKSIWIKFNRQGAASGCMKCCSCSAHTLLESVLVLDEDWNLRKAKQNELTLLVPPENGLT